MKPKLMILLLALFPCAAAMSQEIPASAQRRLVAIDIETLVPVAGANVVSRGMSAQTDTLGRISIPDSCRSLLFSHVNYESRLVNLKEVGDTVFLISKLLNVKEVVVFGKTPHVEEYEEVKKQMTPSKKDLQLAGAQPGDGINILGLIGYIIPKKWKKSKKEKQKESLKRTLEDY